MWSEYEPLLRIGVAAAFGCGVGIERQWHHKSAGVKTNTLVALGAAVFGYLSGQFGPENHNPAQLAAAVVTGIGFIGGGVILRRGTSVQGVNTAATLWANASLGVVVGTGRYLLGTFLFSAILLIQVITRYAARWIDRKARFSNQPHDFELLVDCDVPTIPQINALWMAFAAQHHLMLQRRTTLLDAGRVTWKVSFACNALTASELTSLEERMSSLPTVKRVEYQELDNEDSESG